MRQTRPVTILLVEDDEVDIKALRRAFDELKVINPIRIAHDGVEAWQMLTEIPRPFLVITDVNMPRMNGLELLKKIRESDTLHDSIVFVLTTSNEEQDKIDAYNLNVTGYMLKSEMGASFTRAIELVENYWRVVELPEGSQAD
jgi:CheY-like chemotaxis protein